MRRLILATVAVAAAFVATRSNAEPRNVPGDNFLPSLNGDGILEVHSPKTLEPMDYSSALWLSWADDPVKLYPSPDDDSEKLAALVDSRLGAHLAIGFGLTDFLEVGADIPVVLGQSRDDAAIGFGVGSVAGMAIGDLRLSGKIKILDEDDGAPIGLAYIHSLSSPTRSPGDRYAGHDGFRNDFRVAASRTLNDQVEVMANLTYRGQNAVIVATGPGVIDEMFIANIGGRYTVDEELSISAALRHNTPFNDFWNPAFRFASATELLASADYALSDDVTVTGGLGGAIDTGLATPDVRVFGAVRYNGSAGKDTDGDKVGDSKDQCIDDPEDRDGFEDKDGCPDTDNDGDEVLDTNDGAPNDPEDRDGFQDEDGVPDPDNDGDGFLDADDKCPDHAEDGQGEGEDLTDGCPNVDTDEDGLRDFEDKCPEQAEDADEFEDEDGCPDLDNDADGVTDDADKCPMEAGVVENLGCPDTDGDGDGIVDRLDNCPEEAGTAENQGCAKKQLVKITDEKIEILEKVYFGNGSARIYRRSFKLLDNVAQVLSAQTRIKKIEVQGHTDSSGDDNANLDLSQRRADAVVKYLVNKGVAAERLTGKGYGETAPIDTNGTTPGRANNRRVEFKILELE